MVCCAQQAAIVAVNPKLQIRCHYYVLGKGVRSSTLIVTGLCMIHYTWLLFSVPVTLHGPGEKKRCGSCCFFKVTFPHTDWWFSWTVTTGIHYGRHCDWNNCCTVAANLLFLSFSIVSENSAIQISLREPNKLVRKWDSVARFIYSSLKVFWSES